MEKVLETDVPVTMNGMLVWRAEFLPTNQTLPVESFKGREHITKNGVNKGAKNWVFDIGVKGYTQKVPMLASTAITNGLAVLINGDTAKPLARWTAKNIVRKMDNKEVYFSAV